MNLPEFASYCDNTTKGNALVFTVGALDVYYSYKTPVAFRVGGVLIVRENTWGPTTGKHLNAIDGGDKDAKKRRLGSDAFELALTRAADLSPAEINTNSADMLRDRLVTA